MAAAPSAAASGAMASSASNKRHAPEAGDDDPAAVAASKRRAVLEQDDAPPACGWTDGTDAGELLKTRGVAAGNLVLPLRSLPLHVPLHVPLRALRSDEAATVAIEGVVRQNTCLFFARVVSLDGLTEAERQTVGVAPAIDDAPRRNSEKKKKKRVRRGAVAAAAALPHDAVALALSSTTDRTDTALQLALLRLQAHGHIALQCSVPTATLATGADTLRAQCSVRLLPAAFVGTHDMPDDHDIRNPELALLLDALAARGTSAAAAAAASGDGGVAGFSVHSFYETLRRTARESPAAAPTPDGMTCSLRPYQARAVAWMVAREAPSALPEPVPHPLWPRLDLPGAVPLWANPAIGLISTREAWYRQNTAGGILAEEMGLGKTVEVLALIMSRTCPVANRLQANTPAELMQGPAAASGHVKPALKPIARLVKDLKALPDAAAFAAPAVELFTPEEIPGYQDAVDKPMDLRTVETKLRTGAYSSPHDCADDVRQIFWNCWTYNHESNSTYQCAERLSDLFERRYEAILLDDSPADVSLDERCLKGTLIIAPHSILQQWRDEITRHAPALKVEVYSGLHSVTTFDEKGYAKTEDLTKMKATDDFAAEERRETARQERLLALTKADIVLTTYQALRREVHYASDFTGGGTRALRFEKVYRVPTCPMLTFAWHRVVLDEAQMVESTTAAVATMALRIRARYRWCVTGTPVGARGVQDLHGLLVFLRHEPFSHAFWWDKMLMHTVAHSPRQGMELLKNTLRPIMWRNSKAHVKSELGIPPMSQKLVKLELTTAEREIYNRILKGIRSAAVHGELVESELMQLRLACAHPQMTRFWSSLQTEGQVQGGAQGGGTSLSMSEILERMITMAQQDMEKHERDLCKHLTHLALALLKKPTAGTPRKTKKKTKASRKQIRFADEDADAAEAREAATEAALQSDDDDDNADGGAVPTSTAAAAAAVSSDEPARQALTMLTKAVRVADDGLQVLEKGGEKQTQLETSAGALKSWRLAEIALYRVLAEVYQRLDEEPLPEALLPESICECIVCTKADKHVSHERCKRRQCAIDLIPKKKTEIFEQPNAKQAELEHQLQGVRDQISKLCGDEVIDQDWNRRVHQVAKPFFTKDLGAIPGLRGLSGVGGTENPALSKALEPEKTRQSVQKHKLNEQLRRLEAERAIPFTEPLYNLLAKHHLLMRKHEELMKELLDADLNVNLIIDCDLERQPGGSRLLDRARSPTLTAAERRVFLRLERKEAFETGVDQRDRSALADITVYTPPSSAAELTLEALGTAQKSDLETFSQYYTRQGRIHKAQQAHTEICLAVDDGSTQAAVAGRELIANRSRNIKVCLAHRQATKSLKTLYSAAAQEIAAKVLDGRLPPVVGKVVHVIQQFGGGNVVEAVRLAPGAKPEVLNRAAQGTKMLKYVNENLRKELRQLKDVTPAYPELTGWPRLKKHRQEVFRLNCRLHFLRQIEAEDRCARQVLMSGVRRGEVQAECDKAEKCEEYRARLATINTEAGLLAEQQRLRQRAARSEREGIKQLRHAKFLQHKHEEALKEAAANASTKNDEEGTLCPVCLQIVDEGLLMQCGHFFCQACTNKLLAEPRATCGICRAKISKRSVFRVSGHAASSTGGGLGQDDADQGGAELSSIRVRGDFGTKINALVRFLKHQEQQHARHRDQTGQMGAPHASGGGVGAEGPDDLTMDAFTFDQEHPPKALVYSQWETELVLVSKALAMNSITFVELKGSMQQRSASLHRFNVEADVRVFLLATGVANAGLTLVAATSVFILEPSLNPAIEEQAINRVHRIGQTRPTTAYRFVVADSVEETILDLNSTKRGSFVQQTDSSSNGSSASAAASAARLRVDGDDDEEEASARRWDVEGIERGVLSSLTDTILSPRSAKQTSAAAAAAAESDDDVED